MNFALISGWHVHAGEYFNRANRNPNSKVTAVWDEDPARGKAYAEKNGSKFYECYDELLADPTIDALIITSPTNMHRELMVKAAKAGKHIFTEKVLAITNEDAHAIADAVKEAGIHFTICFPHESEPPFMVIRDLIDSGKLGKITYAKFGDHATSLPASVRFATNGEFRESLQYRYDSMGNIIEVSENGRMVCRYELQTKKLHT